MKIAFLIPISLESPSGLRYLPMARALARRGHQVVIVALHHNLQPSTPRRLLEDGVQVHYVGQMQVRKVGNLKYYYSTPALLRVVVASTWGMLRRALALDVDLVHAGKPQPINGLASLVGGHWVRRRPLFIDCDDYEAETNRFARPWLRRTAVLFEDGLPRFAAGLTVNTHFNRDRMLSLGVPDERIAYVPNGIDRDRLIPPPAGQVEALRRHWELEGRPVVGYTGTLGLTSHAVDLLLDAFALFRAREPRAVLLLVGGGEDYDGLRQYADRLGLGDSARFAGRVPPADVPAYLALANVTVDPVRDDLVARGRSPLKIVESLAVGTPVVTGDVGDRRQMLADGRAGILVKPGSADALADGLADVLGDLDRARSLSQGALEHRESYCWDRLIGPVIRLYEQQS